LITKSRQIYPTSEGEQLFVPLLEFAPRHVKLLLIKNEESSRLGKVNFVSCDVHEDDETTQLQ